MKALFAVNSSYGFLFPALGMAQSLGALGHEVAFTTDRQFQNLIESHGFHFFDDPNENPRAFSTGTWFRPFCVLAQLAHLNATFASFKPDIVISNDLCFGSKLFCHNTGVPLGMLGFGTFLYPANPDSRLAGTRQWRYDQLLAKYHRFSTLAGCSSANPDPGLPDFDPILGNRYFLRTLPDVEPDKNFFPDLVTFCGPLMWEPDLDMNPDLEMFIQRNNDPLLYVQPGRLFQTGHTFLELTHALADKAYRVLVDTHRMDEQVLNYPSNFFISNHIPMGKVLPFAELIISTGMTTSYLAAITHGVPHLVISADGSGVDEICDRVLVNGVGIVLDVAQATGPNIFAGIQYLDNSRGIRKKTEALAQKFKAAKPDFQELWLRSAFRLVGQEYRAYR